MDGGILQGSPQGLLFSLRQRHLRPLHNGRQYISHAGCRTVGVLGSDTERTVLSHGGYPIFVQRQLPWQGSNWTVQTCSNKSAFNHPHPLTLSLIESFRPLLSAALYMARLKISRCVGTWVPLSQDRWILPPLGDGPLSTGC